MSDGQHSGRSGAFAVQGHEAYALARADDLRFLQAWERGLISLVGAAVRIRQIRRALAVPPQAS